MAEIPRLVRQSSYPLAVNRNTTISIAKGIAIILMVIAHAEAPGWLCKFIFEFHMPLFFITAGFFSSTTRLLSSRNVSRVSTYLLSNGQSSS